eukprot:c29530_g1_i1 orf=48-206(-)
MKHIDSKQIHGTINRVIITTNFKASQHFIQHKAALKLTMIILIDGRSQHCMV